MTGEEIKVNMAYRWTKPKEEWIKDINPIIVGKINYYLNVYKVLKKLEELELHCSRRVIVKYRQQLNIPSSTKRKVLKKVG